MKIFLSHTHDDQPLAQAIRQLVEGMFAGSVEVQYSSSDIKPGDDWLGWITETVRACDRTLVMLTPVSSGKPWLLWESGAAAGVGLGTGERTSVTPILYRLDMDAIPSPLRSKLAIQGETREDMLKLLWDLNESSGVNYTTANFDLLASQHLDVYEQAVAVALQTAPLLLTEGVVQEWLSRIDALAAEGRYAEIDHLHWALRLAKGIHGAEEDELMDLRIHRRLGEMYLKAKRGPEAVKQFELACKSSPRDLFLLHQLALARAEAHDLGEALKVVDDRIAQLDPRLLTDNAEVAGLRGRLCRMRWKQTGDVNDLRSARDSYASALKANPSSYYMADNVGQLSLRLGEEDVAHAAFGKSIDAIRKLGETSMWSFASLATAHLVRGEREEAIKALGMLRELKPAPREITSVLEGLQGVAESLGASDQELASWKSAMGASSN